MGYRKFSAGSIFTGREVLTNCTLVTAEDGTIEELLTGTPPDENTQVLQGMLSPGFINCHCHLELSHMKGAIPPATGLVEFVFTVITQRHADKEVMLDAIASAESEMISNGIVAVGDICNNPITLPQKLKRNIYYHNFIEASGYIPSVVPERFKRSADLFNVFAELYGNAQGSNSLVPHAPYSVAPELFHRIISFPGNRLLTMHNQEIEDENSLFMNKTGSFLKLYDKMNIDHSSFDPPGTSSLQASLPYFFPQQSLILVHNVATRPDDIDYINREQVPAIYFCLCPNANLYISGGLPAVDLLVHSKRKIVLGTDSLASNFQLSILEEMNVLKKHFDHLTYEQMLVWATLNGAEALEIQHTYGSFEKGKRPGVILIDDNFNRVQRVM